MANFAFPSELPLSVEVERVAAQRVTRSPYSGRAQVIDRGGRVFRIVIQFQTLTRANAAVLGKFIRDLDGMANTFSFDLNPWCPGWDPQPGTRIFRRAEPRDAWKSELSAKFDTRLEAIEDVA